jgi:hypothetical protein
MTIVVSNSTELDLATGAELSCQSKTANNRIMDLQIVYDNNRYALAVGTPARTPIVHNN